MNEGGRLFDGSNQQVTTPSHINSVKSLTKTHSSSSSTCPFPLPLALTNPPPQSLPYPAGAEDSEPDGAARRRSICTVNEVHRGREDPASVCSGGSCVLDMSCRDQEGMYDERQRRGREEEGGNGRERRRESEEVLGNRRHRGESTSISKQKDDALTLPRQLQIPIRQLPRSLLLTSCSPRQPSRLPSQRTNVDEIEGALEPRSRAFETSRQRISTPGMSIETARRHITLRPSPRKSPLAGV